MQLPLSAAQTGSVAWLLAAAAAPADRWTQVLLGGVGLRAGWTSAAVWITTLVQGAGAGVRGRRASAAPVPARV